MSRVHNFKEDLEKSQANQDASWWWDIYQDRFPNLMAALPIKQDGWAQRGGVDRILVLADGNVLYVDEKVRQTKYPDFLLEYCSSKERGTLGWVEKDLCCDFIAYVFLPTKELYLLPFQPLKMAWRANREKWISKARSTTDNSYRIVEAVNDGYTTQSVAVPTGAVWEAIKDSLKVNWSSFSEPYSDQPLISTEEFQRPTPIKSNQTRSTP